MTASSVLLDDPLLTRTQISEMFGVSPRTVERWQSQRLIPAPLRLGKRGCLRWRKSSLMTFLAKQEAAVQRSA